jgi:hypothetical protein
MAFAYRLSVQVQMERPEKGTGEETCQQDAVAAYVDALRRDAAEHCS